MSVAQLKGIGASGARYAIILRLLKHDSGSKSSASGTKRGQGGNDGAKKPPAKKSKSTRAQVGYNKIERKIASGETNKKYNSHYGAKCHSEDVYELLLDVLSKKIVQKRLMSSNPKLALEIAKGGFTVLTKNFRRILSPGYDMSDRIPEAIDHLKDIVESAHSKLSKVEKTDTLQWFLLCMKYCRITALGRGRNSRLSFTS